MIPRIARLGRRQLTSLLQKPPFQASRRARVGRHLATINILTIDKYLSYSLIHEAFPSFGRCERTFNPVHPAVVVGAHRVLNRRPPRADGRTERGRTDRAQRRTELRHRERGADGAARGFRARRRRCARNLGGSPHQRRCRARDWRAAVDHAGSAVDCAGRRGGDDGLRAVDPCRTRSLVPHGS